MQQIIVHGGSAHFDEFAACALIMACFPHEKFLIDRRDPTGAEIADDNIWVVDVGRNYLPEHRKFDHHQYKGGDSAFVLVSKHLNVWEKLLIAYPQLDFKSRLDTEGPNIAASSIGINVKALMTTLSPIESVILDMFSSHTKVSFSMGGLIKRIGQMWISTAERLHIRLNLLAETANIVPLKEHGYCIISTISEDPDFGMAEFRQQWQTRTGYTISCSITVEKRRNETDLLGTTLYRFADYPGIDFAKLEHKPGVKFAHKGGFLAVIEPGHDPMAFVREAFVSPVAVV